MSILRIILALLLLGLCPASPTLAQDSAEYASVIKQAVAEFDAGSWLEARILFQRAHALNPNARTWRSLGLTAFELRRYVDAVAELEASLVDTRKALSEKQRKEVQELLLRAREFIAVYKVNVAPQEAQVEVDGEPVTLTDGQLFLDPGTHTVVVRAPGYVEEKKELQINEPRREQLTIELRVAGAPETEASATASAPEAPVEQEQTPPKRRRVWTWVLGGTAVAAGLVGAGLGVGALNKNGEYEDKDCGSSPECSDLKSSGQALQLGANVSFGVAGALLAGSVIAWFLEGRSSEHAPKTALYLTPWSAGVRGRF
jgi:hypothetical protein